MQLVARLVRGQALVQLQRPAAAEECLQKAADLLATYSRLRRRRSSSSSGDSAEPLLLRLHTALGRAGAARGRLETARQQLSAALQLLPADSCRHRPARVRLLRELAQLELRGAPPTERRAGRPLAGAGRPAVRPVVSHRSSGTTVTPPSVAQLQTQFYFCLLAYNCILLQPEYVFDSS